MGILGNLIKGNNNKPALNDFSTIGTDMHSHLIPGIDDGCKNIDESLEMLKWLESSGFHKAITTPHIQGDFFQNTPEIIKKGLQELRNASSQAGLKIELDAAAEYLLCPEFETTMQSGELLTLGDNYVLLEMSYFAPYSNIGKVFFELQTAGYNIILAHPERYTYYHNNFSSYTTLKDREIFFQLNTISLTGTYSTPVKKMAEKLIDNGMIDFLGTDLHNHSYVQQLDKSLNEKYLLKLLESGLIKNSQL